MNCIGKTVFKGKCVRGHDVEVLDCLVCGFKHLHPKPTEEELEEYYKKEYFGKEKPDYSAEHKAIDGYWQQVYSEQCEALEKTAMIPWTVLDVGCGRDPVFLRFVMDNNFGGFLNSDYVGIDPSLDRAQNSYEGYTIHPSWEGYEAAKGEDAPSVINLGFVLEHAGNPFEVLSKCAEHMSSKTSLLVEVPFDFNPIQGMVGGNHWVSSPDHLNYFTPTSLRQLLERCGLGVLHLRTTYPVELLKIHGYDYSIDSSVGPQLNKRRGRLQELWRSSGMSQQTKIGRTVWAIAKLS